MRLDEEPYILTIHPDDRIHPDERLPPGTLPPDMLLASSDDDDDDDEDMDLGTVTETLKGGINFDRDEMYNEIDEFLADMSDDEDDDEDDDDDDDEFDLSEGEAEDEEDDDADGEADGGGGGGRTWGKRNGDRDPESDVDSVVSSTTSAILVSRNRKRAIKHVNRKTQDQEANSRKRSRTHTPEKADAANDKASQTPPKVTVSIAEESDEDEGEEEEGSRLAKRQKLARERHSGLRKVVTPTPPGGEEDMDAVVGGVKGKEGEMVGSGMLSPVSSEEGGEGGGRKEMGEKEDGPRGD